MASQEEPITVIVAMAIGATIALVARSGGSMSTELARTAFTYAVALLVILGSFLLIYDHIGDDSQAWLAIGAVMGYVFRDAGGAAATNQAVRLANATQQGAPPQ